MSIYQSIYDLIVTYIFGGSVAVSSSQELVCVLLSTISVIFVFSLPFLLVWKVIRMIGGF